MTPDHIGKQIRQARRALGITQEQLADTLHVTRQTISNWENARSQPDYQTLETLAALLHMNLAEVFGGPEPDSLPEKTADPPADPMPDAPQIVQSDGAQAPAEQAVQSDEAQTPAEQIVQSAKRTHPRRMRLAALALTLAALCLAAAIWPRHNENAYPRAWFDIAQPQTAGCAYIDVYAKVDSVPLSPATREVSANYPYMFFFREMSGVGFQMDTVRFFYFYPDGSVQEESFDKPYLAKVLPSSHINAYGVTGFSNRFYFSPGDAPAPLGVGCVIEGEDDNGHTLAYGKFLPFDPQ